VEKDYIILNTFGDYWSNIDGWTEFEELATVFTYEQSETLRLPIGGKWKVK